MSASSRPKPILRRRSLRRAGVICLGVLLWGLSEVGGAGAEAEVRFRVIVHPKNTTRVASRQALADIFLKRVVVWENGLVAKPADQQRDAPVREAFTRSILGRTVAAVRRYWQQRIFSGRDLPPPELESDAAVVAYVQKEPGAVGYVSLGADIGALNVLEVR